jgi:capsular polysaccharide biosynthesis protein
MTTDTLEIVTSSLGLKSGFAWWLPIVSAAVAALIAVLVSQSSVSAWDADVHLWAREGPSASEYAGLLLDGNVQQAAVSGMMASEDGPAVIEGVAVEVNDTLIRVTVRSARQADAETLAISLAHAAVNESIVRFGNDSGLDMLGLVRPGARKVSPATEWSAAWASAAGLLGGLLFSWLIATRVQNPRSALGRLGRIGLRPIAVISPEAEQAANQSVPQITPHAVGAIPDRGSTTDDAVMLANAINPLSGIVALVPLDDDSGVTATLIQTARTLAARGRSVIWLDGRRPAFQIEYGVPPIWLAGANWSPIERWRLILRSAVQADRASRADRSNANVLLLTDHLSEPSTIEIARAAAGVILMARADASDEQLVHAQLLLGEATLLGVALTQARAPDLRDFELAQMTE